MAQPTLGRVLLTLSALNQAIAPFIFDWNETHIYNKRWPPHAKFHNGQTMSMGVCLGLATLYFTWKPTQTLDAATEASVTAALFGSVYWVAGLSARLYPGSLGVDPEFGEGFPQLKVFLAWVVVTWVGCWVECRRLEGVYL